MWTHTQRFSVSIGCALALFAASCAALPDYSAQRQQFLAAETALQRHQNEQFRSLLSELKHYPLLPYLQYAALLRTLSTATDAEIDAFLTTYADTPLAPRLRRAWLRHSARNGHWKTYLAYYQPQRNTALQCHSLWARHQLGQRDAVLREVKNLWLVGHSQPEACDPLFEAWREAGGLTQPLLWQRYALAMNTRNTRLAAYLGRQLSPEQQVWRQAWIAVVQDPAALESQAVLRTDDPRAREIILFGVNRAIRRDAAAGEALWQRINTHYRFSAAEIHAIERRIALTLALRGAPHATERLASLSSEHSDDTIREWRVRNSLALNDWEGAITWIEHLTSEERHSPRWQYWRARTLEQLGIDDARETYEQLARKRHYYGFLAADRLDLRYTFHDNPLSLGRREQQELGEIPAVQRAHELFRLGRMSAARSEWNLVTHNLSEEQLARAAKLADSWDWHDRAILTVANTAYDNDLELRFPTPYESHVLSNATRQQVDPAWAYAVMRQESAFMADARSRAGAMGLMQLMPGTARDAARAAATRLRRNDELFNADTNIRLGITHLRQVLDRFNDHKVLATAAYNAGHARVEKWLPTNSPQDADLWIETVPYQETRNYLLQVLAYTAVYDYRLGRKHTPLMTRMPPVQAPRTQPADIANRTTPQG